MVRTVRQLEVVCFPSHLSNLDSSLIVTTKRANALIVSFLVTYDFECLIALFDQCSDQFNTSHT